MTLKNWYIILEPGSGGVKFWISLARVLKCVKWN